MTVLDDRTERLLELRLAGEYQALLRQYTVRYNPDDRLIYLDDIELPDGWSPQTITVKIKVPPHYPATGPRWMFPGEIRYHGRVPRHLLTQGHWLIRGTLGDPFIYWPPHWDPNRSTVATETDRALTELVTPVSPRPGRKGDA